MDLSELAALMVHGERKDVHIVAEVIQIDTYLAQFSDQKTINAMFPKNSQITDRLSHDLTLYLVKGGKIKMKLNPLFTQIQRGIIVENTRLIVTRIIKICNPVYFYFLIDSLHVLDSLTTVFGSDKFLQIKGYKPENLPLGGNLGTYILDRMSNIDIINN